MDVTVCVGTFGDSSWVDLANERAIPSARALNVPIVHDHASTLHEARNRAGLLATTEWLAFLDADDELEPGYFDAMHKATADLRAPRVRYVRYRGFPAPRFPRVAGHGHDCTADCLQFGNWLVIGTLIRRDMFVSVGGFRDWPVYEDYDLWVRCWLAGATVEAVPGAVYRAHVRLDSRNRGQLSQAEKHAVHRQIAESCKLPVPA